MLDELLDAPKALFAAVMGVVGHLVGVIDPLWTTLAATSGQWFPSISVLAGIVAPEVAWIPTELATNVLVGAALLYVAILVVGFIRNIS